jgi:Bifunctional DNA primase/polymerase, N-terminal
MIVQQANTKILRDYIDDYTKARVYSLIPLKYGTKNKPLVDWKPYQLRLPTPNEKASWFSKPPCNVAAVLGQASGLVAIDVDGDDAKQRVQRKLVEMGLCNNLRVSMLDTMMTLTGSGGFHFVFRVSPKLFEEYDLSTKTLWEGSSEHTEIKFLGEGSIVMLAPSLHPNGTGQYLWNGKAPIELSEEELKQLLSVFCEKYLPTTLDEHNAANNNSVADDVSSISSIRQSILGNTNSNSLSSLSQKDIQELITALKPAYKVGRRNTITLGYAGVLRKRGYTLRAVEDFCVVVCKTFNDEEIESRLHAVRGTFKKPIDKIAGWSLLNDIS